LRKDKLPIPTVGNDFLLLRVTVDDVILPKACKFKTVLNISQQVENHWQN